jgi:hypothetical protein
MRRLFLIAVLLLAATVAWAALPPVPPPLLPAEFAGWQRSGEARTSTDPSTADAAYVPVLKEYGFQDFAAATYIQGGRKLMVRAARFHDASGAYGAFTFYKQPGMQTEKIGDQGASNDLRVLFYRGNILVDAKFDRLTAMSAAELRELASDLPKPPPDAAKLPTLPQYLPKQSYLAHTAKYVLGPAGLESIDAPLPAALIEFNRGAELVLGRYSTSEGVATLTMISYPTPQIAADRLRAIEAANASPQSGPDSLLAKRTGPIVALVTGDISPAEGKALLASVNYEADVTWNQQTSLSKKDNIGNLIVAIFTLIGILLLIAVVIGFAFGGLRVLLQKVLPGRVFQRDEDVGIIRLNLPR